MFLFEKETRALKFDFFFHFQLYHIENLGQYEFLKNEKMRQISPPHSSPIYIFSESLFLSHIYGTDYRIISPYP